MAPLRIKTWNCFGAGQDPLAYLRRRGVPDARRLAHPSVLAAARAVDVLCLQEVFLAEAEGLFEALDHPYKARDENAPRVWPPTACGSGLAVASRLPFAARTLRPFRAPAVGADRFARKGMLHVRLGAGEGVEVDLITTHLQAGHGERARAVRARQLAELRALVEEAGSAERAFVVCGDLNIDGLRGAREGEYRTLASALPGFEDLGAGSDLITFHPHPERNPLAYRFSRGSPPQRIDYVLFRPARDGRVSPRPCELALDAALVGHGPPTHPSDHFGLVAELCFEVR